MSELKISVELFYASIDKLSRKARRLGYTDFEDLAIMAVTKANELFNPSLGNKFNTILYPCFKNILIDENRRLNTNKRQGKTVTISKFEDSENGNNFELQGRPTNTMEVLTFHLRDAYDNGVIDFTEHNILALRSKGYNFDEIAKKLDISQGSAFGLHSKAIAKMAS